MFPVRIHRRPGADEQLVGGVRAGLGRNVVFVGIHIALVPAKARAVEPGVGVIVGGFKLQTQPSPGETLRNIEGSTIPPFLVTDPLGVAAVDLGGVKPLRVRAAGDFDCAPAPPLRTERRGWRAGALLAPSQFPLAIERNGVRLESLWSVAHSLLFDLHGALGG